jgi:galactose-1-phosphate uridylyltransferase
MTARNLQHLWNQQEYLSVLHTGRSMGGTMTFGIAEVIVKGITHGQVHGRMDGLSMAVANPKALISSMENVISTTKQTQSIYSIHKVTEEMVEQFSASRMHDHLKAWEWPVRPRTIGARRKEMLKAIKQSKDCYQGVVI